MRVWLYERSDPLRSNERLTAQVKQEQEQFAASIETVRQLLIKNKAEDLIPILIPDGIEYVSTVGALSQSLNSKG
jgi:hypothetical protein